MAGWASGSKFPMLGAMRAISQMVSYELPLIISALGVVMVSARQNGPIDWNDGEGGFYGTVALSFASSPPCVDFKSPSLILDLSRVKSL